MVSFIRKSLVTINASFLPQGFTLPPNTPWPFPSGGGPLCEGGDWSYSTVPPEFPVPVTPPTQPTQVECVLQFTNPGGSLVTTTIPMTLSG